MFNLFAGLQILVAYLLGEWTNRAGRALLAVLIGLSTLVVMVVSVRIHSKPSTLPFPLPFARSPAEATMIYVGTWLIFSVPAVAAFYVNRFRRQGRPRMAALSLFWGLLVGEGYAAYAAIENVKPAIFLCVLLFIAVTLIGGSITIFALPPDRAPLPPTAGTEPQSLQPRSAS